jgi:DNA-directed RNA polymerase subunit K/omega
MADQLQKDEAGLDDVMRSVRVLARRARQLVEDAGEVAEREVAMVLTATEEVRDRVISKEALGKARQQTPLRGLRQDTQRAVDLAFDAAAMVYVFGVEIVERVLERRRSSTAPVADANA